MFWCRHKWQLMDKTVLESAWEQLMKHGGELDIRDFSPKIFQKKVIVVVVCEKCGKLREICEHNPG